MKIFSTIFILLVSLSLSAQDIHFTNFHLAPMSLNPALTGDFAGTLRAGGIYRDQNTGGYNSIAGGLEFNIPLKIRKLDWISIGAEYINDRERVVSQTAANTLTQTNLALAYHFVLDKDYKNVITAAVQYKVMASKFDPTGLDVYTDFSGGGSNPTIAALAIPDQDTKGKALKDWIGAISYKSNFGKKGYFQTGLSFAHFIKYDKSVTSPNAKGKIDEVPFRLTGFAQSEIFFNPIMSIQPTVYFQYQSPFSEIAVQALYGLIINEADNVKINPGIGYRVGDAVEFLFVMDYKKFKAGLSFDLTSSKYRSSEGVQNGIEFGLSYTTSITKKPKVKPVIFCPRL